jgi:PPK2 family polyphosphate:nucleotide phosphotransferase
MDSSFQHLSKQFRINKGKNFRLKDFDPADTGKLKSAAHADELLGQAVGLISELQKKLYAQNSWALLLIFQGMDAAGKDGTISHVLSGVNPQGCEVTSFKAPSTEELDHDYLWRTMKALPRRGRIGIFNRSYYEEVLVARVHPEFLTAQKLPSTLVTSDIWKERYQDIRAVERHLSRNGTVIRKFFLHVSKEEQRKRFLERLESPKKNWKFSTIDVAERQHWDSYMEAYEDMIRHTATKNAPWYAVPADNKWFMRTVVASVIVETLESLDLRFPKLNKAQLEDLAVAKQILLDEG